MDKLKNTIRFSTFLEEENWATSIDLTTQTIQVIREDETAFKGSIDEFKKLEKLKPEGTGRVYNSILSMSKQLMDILTRA